MTITILPRNKHLIADRHAIPNPKLSVSNAETWENTLLKSRISDLFRTVKGLSGHVVQVQNEINRVSNLNGVQSDVVATISSALCRIFQAVEICNAQYLQEGGTSQNLMLNFPLLHRVVKI